MSPYENRLQSESFRRIALISGIKADSIEQIDQSLSSMPGGFRAELKRSGIHNLALYRKHIEGAELLLVYFETTELDQEQAIALLKRSSDWWNSLELNLLPHPRSTDDYRPWIRAEFMNVIAVDSYFERPKGERIALVAKLVPDKELWYRTLHQTNWPGVVDQMRRSNYRNWTTFLIDWEGQLLLFSYVEYVGDDQTEDDKRMADDPVTQRWWTHTQPCISPISGSEAAWTPLRSLVC